MLPYISEFIGTMLLILLGDGVVANVNLDRSGMKGAGAVQITFAWGLAVLVPAFIFGSSSGAHFIYSATFLQATTSTPSPNTLGITTSPIATGAFIVTLSNSFMIS